MDLRQRITDFLRQYQTTGWLLAFMVGGLLLQGLLYLVLVAMDQTALYERIVDGLVLPPTFKEWIYQPWSLVSYPFFSPGFDLLNLVFSGLILWSFGRIHQQLLGEQRTRRLVILGIPLIGLITLTITSIAGYQYRAGQPYAFEQPQTEQSETAERVERIQSGQSEAEEGTSDKGGPSGTDRLTDDTSTATTEAPGGVIIGRKDLAYVSGMMAIIMIMVISCITLVPDYPVQLFLLGQVKIVWVGLVLFLLSWGLWASFYTPMGIAVFLGGGLGFLHVYLLRNGTDLTEVVWSFYSDRGNQPRMKVKYGTKSSNPARSKSARSPSSDDKNGGIPQEIIDGILDKISDKGYDSLSREEKELLFKASTQKDDDVD
jgi:hypothetical protein